MLQTTPIDLTFSAPQGTSGGVREDIDERVAPIGTWKTLLNVYFPSEGSVSKRNGYAQYGTQVARTDGSFDSLNLGLLERLDVVDRKLVLTRNQQNAGSRGIEKLSGVDTTGQLWVETDTTCPASLKREPAARVATQLAHGQSIPVGNLTYTCWIPEGGGGTWVSAKDTATGAIVQRPFLIEHLEKPPVLIRAGQVAIVVGVRTVVGGKALTAWSFDSVSLAVGAHDLVTLIDLSFVYFDACPYDDTRFQTVYYRAGGVSLDVNMWETAGWTSAAHTTIAATAPTIPTIASTPGVATWVAFYDSPPRGTGVYAIKLNDSTLVPFFTPAAQVSTEGLGTPLTIVVGIQGGAFLGDATVAWSQAYADSGIRTPATTVAHRVGNEAPVTPLPTIYRCFLASRPFLAADNRMYAVTFTPYGDELFGLATLGASGFAEFGAELICLDATGDYLNLQSDPILAGHFATREAWTFPAFSGVTDGSGASLPSDPKNSRRVRNHVLQIPGQSAWQTGLEVISGGVFTPSTGDTLTRPGAIVGVDTLTFDFSHANGRMLFAPGPAGASVSAGAMTGYYDAQVFCELGFIYGPPIVRVDSIGGGAGTIASGTYRYVAVYEWTDKLGVLHQSAPSVPRTVVVDAAAGPYANNAGITLTIGTVPLTRRGAEIGGSDLAGPNPVTIAVYREQPSAPGVFYRLTGSNYQQPAGGSGINYAPPSNRKDLAAVPFADKVPASGTNDAESLALGTLVLPEDGGALSADPVPPSLACCSHQHRLFVASADDPQAVHASIEFVRGEAPRTNLAQLLVRLDDCQESITALAGLNDKLLIWTASRLYYTYGPGWSDTGQGAGYAEPVLVTSEAGCVEPRSLAQTAEGVYFLGKGRAGRDLYLVDGNMNVTRIGAGVQDTLAAFPTVLQASVDPSREMVIWLVQAANGATRHLVWSYAWKRWVTWDTTVLSGELPPAPSISQVLLDGAHYHLTASGIYKETQSGPSQWIEPGGGYVQCVIQSQWIHAGAVGAFERLKRVAVNANCSANWSLFVNHYIDYKLAGLSQTMFWPANFGPDTYVGHVEHQKCQSFMLTLFELAPVVIDPDPDHVSGGVSLSSITVELGAKAGVAKVGKAARS